MTNNKVNVKVIKGKFWLMVSIRVLTVLVTHSWTGTIRNFWLWRPSLLAATRGAQSSVEQSFTLSTEPNPLLIVKSSSKCHFWLAPPLSDHTTMSPDSLPPEISRTCLKVENSVVNFSENLRQLCTIKINFPKYQLNAQFFYSSTIYMIHYAPQRVSSSTLLIIRRTNCITTASGIVTLKIGERSYINKMRSAVLLKQYWGKTIWSKISVISEVSPTELVKCSRENIYNRPDTGNS